MLLSISDVEFLTDYTRMLQIPTEMESCLYKTIPLILLALKMSKTVILLHLEQLMPWTSLLLLVNQDNVDLQRMVFLQRPRLW